jgi:hypothetical protein
MIMKRKIKVIVEKTKQGYSAYTVRYPIGTTGDSIETLRQNIVKAINLYNSELGKEFIVESNLLFKMGFV